MLFTSLSTIIARVMKTMTPKFCHSASGSTCSPTETKKTAAKRSVTGRTTRSMRRRLRASAMMAPARKAPTTSERPSPFWAKQETPQQMPSAAMRTISSPKRPVT